MTNASIERHNHMTRAIVRWAVRTGVFYLILAACLFIPAGRTDWPAGWACIGALVVSHLISALILLSVSPELLVERAGIGENTKKWDIPLAFFIVYSHLFTAIVAGLDRRNNWTPDIPAVIQAGALAVAVLGHFLTTWAMVANKFFSGFVRIQEDRGHVVAAGGPYRYVRHPGYVGAVVFYLMTPLVLNALWAFVPAALAVCAIIVRTALEDRTLQAELPGYKEYAQQTRYRLLPGVW
ncbi:MAG: isoprenylcysteine carboxylmethyltransferase family protein [Anaerolineae bacterium]|nr:isoprenylcysteine carboxylmethyltransferase family protein [Anaerolineae bacterium]